MLFKKRTNFDIYVFIFYTRIKFSQITIVNVYTSYSNMTSFKRFESKPVVKLIYTPIVIYDVIDNL